MNKAIVFSDTKSLELSDVRYNVLRIPEVVMKIRSAQQINDNLGEEAFFKNKEFFNYLNGTDEEFNSDLKFKRVLGAIVQLGLYDRYISKFGSVSCLMGNINGVSTLEIVTGKKTMEELLQNKMSEEKNVFIPGGSIAQLLGDQKPELILSGVKMKSYGVYEIKPDGTWGEMMATSGALIEQVRAVIEEVALKALVEIGPGNNWVRSENIDLSLYDVKRLDSIDIDPMLSWFWPTVKGHQTLEEAV